MNYNYKEPLEYILKLLVTHPEELEVRQEEEGTVVNLYVKANKEDYGIIIGKGGQRIKNIKNILTVKAVKDGVKINIHVDEEGKKESKEETPPAEETE
ncbi:MAG TPA: KH domain-containing protein [candidate division WWE3 bacterium]|uniref:KH domain-containing protein n=1 Tax=candidate division WWE3 bacterium TaxID=2053526 RepID=A0A7V5J087_UNCKA|nr:KH domain-containing protein [candidate division WWE3 bacterium]